jgi:ankyrin repeat protein
VGLLNSILVELLCISIIFLAFEGLNSKVSKNSFYYAVRSGWTKSVQCHLDKKEIDINYVKNDRMVIDLAVAQDDAKTIELLLKYGAAPNDAYII